MAYKSDIEIAQECTMAPITEVAAKAGIDDRYLEQYGKYKAKINYSLLKESEAPDGKLVLVTAINPTPAGEGKTTTTVGLADGLRKIGKKNVWWRSTQTTGAKVNCPVWWRSTPSPQTQRRNWIWWSRNAGNWG